jgi:hypothetical protein
MTPVDPFLSSKVRTTTEIFFFTFHTRFILVIVVTQLVLLHHLHERSIFFASDKALFLQPMPFNKEEMTVTRESFNYETMTPSTTQQTKTDDPLSPTTAYLATLASKSVTKASPSSSAAISAAAKRLEEKKRELQALRAILLKKHKSVSPVLHHPTQEDSPPPERTVTDNETHVEQVSTTTKDQSAEEEDMVVVQSNSKQTKNDKDKNKKRRPLTLSQVKNKQRLLRMRRRHAREGYKGTLWNGFQMIVSEIVFACTPMVGGSADDAFFEDKQESDGNVLLCSTMEKTAKSLVCLGKDTRETVVDDEDDDDANSIITKPKDMSVDYMPKFKSGNATIPTDAELGGDETFSCTAVTTNTTTLEGTTSTAESMTSDSLVKVLMEHQRQRKQVREALEGRSVANAEPPIPPKKTDTNQAKKSILMKEKLTIIGEGKQSDPIVLEEKEVISTHPTNKKYQGNATADAPLLLLSESIENLVLQGKDSNKGKTSKASNSNSKHKIPSVEATQRILRLLSKDSNSAIILSRRGDSLSFMATTSVDSTLETLTESHDHEEGDSLDDNVTDENDDDTSVEDYRDMDQKMMLQARLAQLKKIQQKHRRLGKQQHQVMKNNKTVSTDSTPSTTATTTAVLEQDEDRNNNFSNHSHLTRATAKCNNTSSRMTMVVDDDDDDQQEDAAATNVVGHHQVENVGKDVAEDVVVDDDEVRDREPLKEEEEHVPAVDAVSIFEQPLDAELLYNSSGRTERRLKELEEMKQILGNSNRPWHTSGIAHPSSSSHVMNHHNYANVYDLQRATNFSALQALRQRHLDVIRMQLEE